MLSFRHQQGPRAEERIHRANVILLSAVLELSNVRVWDWRNPQVQIQQMLQEAEGIRDWIVERRRKLHRHPELMYEEVRTSQLVRDTLDDLGISYRYPLAETGVLATLGGGNGPCVALRADMDAQPIHEEADVPFRS